MDHESALGTVQSMLANEKADKAHNEKRLKDYEDDFSADPQNDTAAQIDRTKRKITNNAIRIEALEYAVKSLDINQYYESVYNAAASLFDCGETVDLSREYHRGVTEMVMRLIGIDAEDAEDVAKTISGHTLDLRYFAGEWARTHGTNVYEGISVDINDWAAAEERRTFSADELDTIISLLEGAKIVF